MMNLQTTSGVTGRTVGIFMKAKLHWSLMSMVIISRRVRKTARAIGKAVPEKRSHSKRCICLLFMLEGTLVRNPTRVT